MAPPSFTFAYLLQKVSELPTSVGVAQHVMSQRNLFMKVIVFCSCPRLHYGAFDFHDGSFYDGKISSFVSHPMTVVGESGGLELIAKSVHVHMLEEPS